MGVFHDMIVIVNRTAEPLAIMYDGQRHHIEPNYTPTGEKIEGVVNLIPRQVLPFALNQTVIMGSEDFRNPGHFRSKIGVIDPKDKKRKSWHEITFLAEKETEITRVPREQIMDEAVNDPQATIVVKGKAQHSALEASMGDTVPTPFDLRTK